MKQKRTEGFIMTIVLIVIALALIQNVLNIDIIGYIKTTTLSMFIDDLGQVSHDTWITMKSMILSLAHKIF